MSSAETSHRVLFVDQTSALGGAELSLWDIVRLRGFRDRIVLFQHGPFEEMLRQAGMEVIVSELAPSASNVGKSSGMLGALRSAGSLRKQLQTVRKVATDCRVLYANTPKAFIITALAGFLTRLPVIYHVRDILSRDHFSDFNRQLIIRLSRFIDAEIIANSKATAEAFVAAGGRQEKIHVVYNGIDRGPWESARKAHANLRLEQRGALGLAEQPVVGVFGRIAEWKGQHVAIRAIAKLPAMHLVIVGSPLFGEDDYAASLPRLAEELGVGNRVHFLGFRRDLPELMQACDVIVHTSVSPEPFGRVIVEGMLAGRPVIASRAGGAAEIIEDGVTGVLATPGDPAHLAQCIQQVIDDQALQQRLATNGLEVAQKRFDVVTRIQDINRIIDGVVEKDSPGHT
jgi:glycosyltransferase involved in cell wall biosynthesis